jgi:hypothetical protein
MLKNWFFLLTSHSVFALTTLTVTTNTDDDAGGFGEMGLSSEEGDLRYCLNTMNTDLNMGMMDDYAITFDSPMTIELNGILPIINNSVNPVTITIGNPGSTPTVTIDGNSGAYSGFFIPTGNVTIQNMIFQNLTAKGGNGGDGISGGGGGMGAGAAIYAPSTFLNGSGPTVTLMNVLINECSAVGGNGGSCLSGSPSGNEGGGGGGGFSGNGGSITTTGSTGGGGGGGFGGNGGDVTESTDDVLGGGGGGGGGIGSRANTGTANLGNGGADVELGTNGNGYGLTSTAGSGGGGYSGGNNAGGGGGGGRVGEISPSGGGGGGSDGGQDGGQPQGSMTPGGAVVPSGGNGVDGGGGGGGGVVAAGSPTSIDGKAGSGGYAGGGGGGAGAGPSDTGYTVEGGSGGTGGGGGGGGVDQSGTTVATGGDSAGGGGGGGGGPSNGSNALGGTSMGNLGGGDGGSGADTYGSGGGGGGGGSGLGGAIFVDSGLNFTIQAFSGVPTIFNTTSTTTQAGEGGTGSPGAEHGNPGSALGNSIFLRAGSSLSLRANDVGDLLTLGDEVSFIDDTSFSAGGTNVSVSGNGTVIYNGTTNYQGSVMINNANFKVNGTINDAAIFVCRNSSFSAQRGTLSGNNGVLTGVISVNSGTISPDTGGMLTLGSLTLRSADGDAIGSLVHIEINSSGTSLVQVTEAASLAGILEIDLDPSALPGTYHVLTSSGITGTFDSVAFTGTTPNYSLSYLPIGSPTFVQFDFLGITPPSNPTLSTQGLRGNNLRVANYLNRLGPDANALGLTDQFELLNGLSFSQYQNALEAISPVRNSSSTFVAQNVMFMFSESLASHFTKRRLAGNSSKNRYAEETAFVAGNELLVGKQSPRNTIYAPAKNTDSQLWAMGFGQFSRQNSQDQTPAFNFNTGGFLVAYDYGNSDQGCIGALAGYAHSSVQQKHSMGNSDLDAGYLSIYGMRSFSDFFIDAAIWGEYMSVDQERTISFPGFDETAQSFYYAEQLDLHFGTGYDFNINTGTIEPFGLLDWVVEWDPSYTEKGAIPYNMTISSRTSWMLRFETGLNGYQTSTYNWGVFIARGKLSYVYKKPHHVGHLNAVIVSAPASFGVEAFTVQQSLISPAIELFWQTNWNGYGSISYDGEFGSGYASNQFYGKIGYSF